MKKLTGLMLFIMCFSLVGCSTAPRQTMLGYGTIKGSKVVAKTAGEYKTYMAHDVAVGATTGAVAGAVYGVVGAGVVGGLMVGTVGVWIPVIGPMIALTSLAVGVGAGALIGGVVGESKKYFKKGYLLVSYHVKMRKRPRAKSLQVFQFTKFVLPRNAPVAVYFEKPRRSKQPIYFVKPIVAKQ